MVALMFAHVMILRTFVSGTADTKMRALARRWRVARWYLAAMVFTLVALGTLIAAGPAASAADAKVAAPSTCARFDPAEFVVTVDRPFGPAVNPFTDVSLTAKFTTTAGPPIVATGFADAADGRELRVRFSPPQEATYGWTIELRGPGLRRDFTGTLRCGKARGEGPVVVDPVRPQHFRFAGSGRPFYHLGITAYHLLDPSQDDAAVDRFIDYAADNGFNKIRFLLVGYPRDFDQKAREEDDHGVRDPVKTPNYGALAGRVNALPAWAGEPHRYDFTRFNVSHWQRVDRAIRRMRDKKIVAGVIVTIEKDGLPDEYGRLTEHELRLYRYAVSRLAAFDNVWWDLGNEHNEYRDAAWGEAMGRLVRDFDPYDRPTSAHAYEEFWYGLSPWADYVITQHYGDERAIHGWVMRHKTIAKPYVNEEYGYEGELDAPDHRLNASWVLRCHWSIAMAGGYATYGDWSRGTSWFYMGIPGPGIAARQLKHLRALFETLPFADMAPKPHVVDDGFALAKGDELLLLYFPRGETARFVAPARAARAEWFDPRTGKRQPVAVKPGGNELRKPSAADWALVVR
jgi:hypothetical protein